MIPVSSATSTVTIEKVFATHSLPKKVLIDNNQVVHQPICFCKDSPGRSWICYTLTPERLREFSRTKPDRSLLMIKIPELVLHSWRFCLCPELRQLMMRSLMWKHHQPLPCIDQLITKDLQTDCFELKGGKCDVCEH